MKIGKVLVLDYIGITNIKDKKKYWKCKCDCGNIAYLESWQLTRNEQPSCPKCRLTVAKKLSGLKFNLLTVIKEYKKRKNGLIVWKCKCDCGKITKVRTSCLLNGHTKSCGCLQKKAASATKLKWIGQKINRLTILKRVGKKWLCLCDCGKKFLTVSTCIKDGRTKSCGCLRIEKMKGPLCRFWKGGVTEQQRGLKKTSAYSTWSKNIKKRDNYTCKKCGFYKVKKIHAHHIHNFVDAIDISLDLNNGITLCEKCHKLFHKIYGKRKNNIKQLKEFLNET